MTETRASGSEASVAAAVEFLGERLQGTGDLAPSKFIMPLAEKLGITFEDSKSLLYRAIDEGKIELTGSYRLRFPALSEPEQSPVAARIAASWDETFMRMAEVVANRSKDPSAQVGACIVSADNRILSLGYNGTPNGWDDSSFPWGKVADDPLETKYPFVIHAERNAVLNYGGLHSQLKGAKVYVTHFPCNECAKELVQVGVAEVIYAQIDGSSELSIRASLKIFETCGVEVRLLELI